MYRGFNLVVSAQERSHFARYRSSVRASDSNKADFEKLKHLLTRQQLDGSEVKAAWFGDVPADVFLSHAHVDRDLALDVADFLEATLNLRVFVDSRVWGEANALLHTFDKLHCWSDKRQQYDYDQRNYSTSHVHMMLATALTEMIDQSECVIFLNTPSSIQVDDAEDRGAERTASPWIYHELMMTRLIARRLDRLPTHLEKAMEAYADAAQDRAIDISYRVPLGHLRPLRAVDVLHWGERRSPDRHQALDWLYDQHPPSSGEIAAVRHAARQARVLRGQVKGLA